MEDLIITSDKNRLDIAYITDFIARTYWAKDRTLENMRTCIENSLNFGMFLDEQQIGYARVVTDYYQFAYLMDVFIDEKYRGNGYSKMLIKHVLECDALKDVRVIRLATADAHGLYKQFGFTELAKPENMMELLR